MSAVPDLCMISQAQAFTATGKQILREISTASFSVEAFYSRISLYLSRDAIPRATFSGESKTGTSWSMYKEVLSSSRLKNEEITSGR